MMAAAPPIPPDLHKYITAVGHPVTSADVDIHNRWESIRNRSYRFRTVVKAWHDQQTQDRMRKTYATWLLAAMSVQLVVINVIFVLPGCEVLKYQPWTANTFVMAVFAEIAGLVLLDVKYLFAPPGEKILRLIERLKAEGD